MGLLRNILHLSGSSIPLSYLCYGKSFAFYFTLFLLFSVGVVELLRIKGIIKAKWLRNFLKPEEQRRPTGSFYFLLGSFLAIALYKEKSAILSLFILSFSDPLARTVGSIWKEPKILRKSLWGSLSFFLSAFLILRIAGVPNLTSLLTSIFSTLTEVLSQRIDDNLTIPIISGLLLDSLPT